jgi:mitochondrial chaperone BCS1
VSNYPIPTHFWCAVHAIAGELDLDIYVISLSKRDMDDAELSKLISSLPPKSIALMEDIDAVCTLLFQGAHHMELTLCLQAFTQSVTREPQNAPIESPPVTPMISMPGYGGRAAMKMQASMRSSSPGYVTLAGLLGAIDGVAAQEGRILFATTNHYQALDPALRRPGRLDVHVEFKLASSEQAKELFTRFYPATIEDEQPENSKPAEPLIDLAEEKTKPNGIVDMETQSLSAVQLSSLAKEFASKIPEHELSMAAIQGHLMRYKTRPYRAVAETTTWVESERKQKKEWESGDKN